MNESRRKFLITSAEAAAAVGLTASGAIAANRLGFLSSLDHEQPSTQDQFLTPDRPLPSEASPLRGEKIKDAEIISEHDLITFYNDAIKKSLKTEVNGTIIRSTLYHAMRFFGLDEKLALERTKTISIDKDGEAGCTGAIACVFDSQDGYVVKINKTFFEDGWVEGLQTIAHEAGHAAIKKVDHVDSLESYGELGSIHLYGERSGFVSRGATYAGPINDILIDSFDDGSTYFAAEEFFAETAKRAYIDYLNKKGLTEIDEISSYPNFSQGVVELLGKNKSPRDIDWQTFLGRDFSFDTMNGFHGKNDRRGFFIKVGKLVIDKNPINLRLSAENIPALGAVFFHDFIDFNLTNYHVANTLLRNSITDAQVYNLAGVLNTEKARIRNLQGR